MSRGSPVQKGEYGVWVKVDDSLGWRIVHEGDNRDEAIKIATMMVVHKYPVTHVELRDLDGPTSIIFEYSGDMP